MFVKLASGLCVLRFLEHGAMMDKWVCRVLNGTVMHGDALLSFSCHFSLWVRQDKLRLMLERFHKQGEGSLASLLVIQLAASTVMMSSDWASAMMLIIGSCAAVVGATSCYTDGLFACA